MKRLTLPLAAVAMLLATAGNLIAQDQPEFPLWEKGAPGALGNTPFDIPTLTSFAPDSAKSIGSAVIICPGGAYWGLAGSEGVPYAKWFAQNGIAAFVLKYRLASHGYHHPIMLQDAARALRTVRANAAKWNIDPQRIGIIGSSAGGHLASTLLTHFDAGKPDSEDPVERVSSRPAFGILCYAVITMGTFTHAGSRDSVLGSNKTPEMIEFLSNEKQVTKETPPCFIWHTWEDAAVPAENSLEFARSLREKGVPFDLHIYQKGKHGTGLGGTSAHHHPWTSDCLFWLQAQGFAKQDLQ